MNRHVLTVATLALGLFCPQLAAAPSQGARYSVTGSVIDQTQAFVPKAQLTLTEISRDRKHKTRSDGEGRFGFDDPAVDAIAQWQFDPIYLNCQPMPTRLTVDIEFTEES